MSWPGYNSPSSIQSQRVPDEARKEPHVSKTLSRTIVLMAFVLFGVVGAAGVLAFGQTQAPPAQTPVPATPPQGGGVATAPPAGGAGASGVPAAAARTPDQIAFAAIAPITDPAKRLEAYRKFQVDFPTSSAVQLADSQVLDLLINNWPDRTDEISQLVDRVVGNIPSAMPGYLRMSQVQTLATKLVDKKILLDKAETLIGDCMEFVEKDFRNTRAQGIETLALIRLMRGDVARAEKEFKDAFTTNPALTRAPLELARIEAKRGNGKAALEYYLPLMVQARLKPAEEAEVRALYTRTNGAGADIDKALDKAYHDKYPNPVKAEAYTRTGAAATSKRVVLAEMFTGSGCPPCVAADLALEAVLVRYPTDTMVGLAYHANIPAPDPMVVAGSEVRRKYYAVTGVPTFEVDGVSRVGGGGRDNTGTVYKNYMGMIEKAIEKPAAASVSVSATTDGSTVKVRARVSDVKGDAKDLRLQLVLAEHELRFAGENGIRFHPLVVRDVAGENHGGFAVNATGETTTEWTFDLATIRADIKKTIDDEIARRRKAEPPGGTPRDYRAENKAMIDIDPAALSVVAFVQAADKSVLQAAKADVKR